jgi:predicted  nucleic acid-binding Zn-ribbon protein
MTPAPALAILIGANPLRSETMPVKPWAELPADEKADELKRWFDAFEANEKRNVLERATRFEKIEKQVSDLAETLKQIQSRLDRLEGRNQQ